MLSPPAEGPALSTPGVASFTHHPDPSTMQQHNTGVRGDPVFPSLGSTMGGVATHSYMVSDGGPGTTGSVGGPLAYISFQQPTAASQSDEIRTIFVTGFPEGVHERELHNLCRFIPGYEASQVSFKPNQQPQVFVLFTSAAYARQAMDALAGLPFDVQHTATTVPQSGATSSSSVSNAAKALPPSDERMSATHASSGALDPSTTPTPPLVDKPAPAAAAAAAASEGPSTTPTQAAAAASSMARLTQYVQARAQGHAQMATNVLNHSGSNVLNHSSSSSLSNSLVRPLDGSTPLVSHMVQLVPVKYHLRCEMAHKNLYVKDGDPTVRRPHRQIVLRNNPEGPPTMPGMVAHTGTNSSGAVCHVALPQQPAGATTAMYLHDVPMYSSAITTGVGAGPVAGGLSMHPLAANAAGMTVQHPGATNTAMGTVPLGTPLGFLPVTNRGDNPPCNTLFIGNLSDQVSELELLHLLSTQPGYRQMKLVRGPRQVSCFVEFEDTPSASQVHNALQGAVLASSDRGGIRIQYSKNPFGKRSSTPGQGPPGLRALGLPASSSDLAAMGSNWPLVTYHSAHQHTGQPSLNYY